MAVAVGVCAILGLLLICGRSTLDPAPAGIAGLAYPLKIYHKSGCFCNAEHGWPLLRGSNLIEYTATAFAYLLLTLPELPARGEHDRSVRARATELL